VGDRESQAYFFYARPAHQRFAPYPVVVLDSRSPRVIIPRAEKRWREQDTLPQFKIIDAWMMNGKNLSSSSKERMESDDAATTRKLQMRRRVINSITWPRRAFNNESKKAIVYKTGDLVAIERATNDPLHD
jgi:hypothetical protein